MTDLRGETVDNYRILDIVGKGGMGIVYRAQHILMDKIVALKTMDPVLAHDKTFLKRFQSEGKALARLENNHIVRIFDLRQTPAGMFIVMEYITGQTIRQYIRTSGPFTWQSALPIIDQSLAALAHAHHVGVIHRDIKPSNIMVTPEGLVKVMDFGLAKVNQQSGVISTFSQGRAGTLFYMSPEQAKGLLHVDHRSDIYSLGITIYEMLTGTVPFDKTDFEYKILKAIAEEDYPTPTALGFDVPEELSAVLQKMLAKNPEDRYQSAEEVQVALSGLMSQLSLPQDGYSSRANRSYTSGVSNATGGKSSTVQSNPAFVSRKSPSRSLNKTKPARKTGIILGGGLTALAFVALLYFVGLPFLNSVAEPQYLASFRAYPPAAYLQVDNDPRIVLPDDINLSAGEHQITLSKDGFTTLDTTIFISETIANKFSFSLLQSNIQNAQSAREQGLLSVKATPLGASVLVDGVNVGETPLNDIPVSAGQHELVIQHAGYQSVTQTVDIVAQQALPINVSLIATGLVSILSIPEGAAVLIDGNQVGITPWQEPLPLGNHQVEIRQAGFANFRQTLIANREENVIIRAVLDELIGTFRVRVLPAGRILLNGTEISNNGQWESMNLTPGTHLVNAVSSDGTQWHKSIVISHRQTNSFTFDFNEEIKVRILSTPRRSNIIVDGQPQGRTPREIKLTLGEHIIEVQKDGFESQTDTLLFESTPSDPIRFTLVEKVSNQN